VSIRSEITTSPLRARLGDLMGLPPAIVISDENDVLKDEAEAYARCLIEAGAPTTTVRDNGILHAFMMLKAPRRHGQQWPRSSRPSNAGSPIHPTMCVSRNLSVHPFSR
jgi:acetyl esterase/lipase